MEQNEQIMQQLEQPSSTFWPYAFMATALLAFGFFCGRWSMSSELTANYNEGVKTGSLIVVKLVNSGVTNIPADVITKAATDYRGKIK